MDPQPPLFTPAPRSASPFVNARGEPYARSTPVNAYTLRNGVDLGNLSPNMRAFVEKLAASGVVPTFEVTSGFRDAQRNAAVGGARQSRHTSGDAIDISTRGWDDATREKFLGEAIARGARGLGVYPDGSFHFDMRETPAAWGPRGHSSSPVDTFPQWAQAHVAKLTAQQGSAPQVARVTPPPPGAQRSASPPGAAPMDLMPAVSLPASAPQVDAPQTNDTAALGAAFAALASQFAPAGRAAQPAQSAQAAPLPRAPLDMNKIFANLQGPLVGRVVA